MDSYRPVKVGRSPFVLVFQPIASIDYLGVKWVYTQKEQGNGQDRRSLLDQVSSS